MHWNGSGTDKGNNKASLKLCEMPDDGECQCQVCVLKLDRRTG